MRLWKNPLLVDCDSDSGGGQPPPAGGTERIWGGQFADRGYTTDGSWNVGEHAKVWWNIQMLDLEAWGTPSTAFRVEVRGPTADVTNISEMCFGETDGGYDFVVGQVAPVTFGGASSIVLNPGDVLVSDDIPLSIDPQQFQGLAVGVEFSDTSKLLRNSDHHDGSLFCIAYSSDGEGGACDNLTGVITLTSYTGLVTRIWVDF